jgi:hypothetical protein
VDAGRVRFETIREHYGIWRWKIERQSSNRLVTLWTQIGSSSLDDAAKVSLANVAWALASFERSYGVLVEDIVRAERARNVGVPAVMKVLTGPYQDSLDYLLAMSLWMDLGDVLVAYRTIMDRFGHLRNAARGKSPAWPKADVDRELAILEARRIPELSIDSMRDLAAAILHLTWHPNKDATLAVQLYWKGDEPMTLDFAEGDLRGRLNTLVEETLEQVCEFILAVLQPNAPAPLG